MQLLTYTNGDVSEALQWMNELDKQYELTDREYGMGDFIEDLKEKGYITENEAKRRNKNHSKNRTGHPQKKPGRNFWQAEKNKAGQSPDF